jgi:hypothetical protein
VNNYFDGVEYKIQMSKHSCSNRDSDNDTDSSSDESMCDNSQCNPCKKRQSGTYRRKYYDPCCNCSNQLDICPNDKYVVFTSGPNIQSIDIQPVILYAFGSGKFGSLYDQAIGPRANTISPNIADIPGGISEMMGIDFVVPNNASIVSFEFGLDIATSIRNSETELAERQILNLTDFIDVYTISLYARPVTNNIGTLSASVPYYPISGTSVSITVNSSGFSVLGGGYSGSNKVTPGAPTILVAGTHIIAVVTKQTNVKDDDRRYASGYNIGITATLTLR